jgi:putative transposase
MVNYRRAIQAGGTFFFTLTLKDRRSDLLVRYVNELRQAFRDVRQIKPFSIDAMVVLPEHLHAMWTLPPDDSDYSGRWRVIKSCFVRRLRQNGVEVSINKKGEAGVWQRRFWEHQIRDEKDDVNHFDYIHINPMNHGLVRRTGDWRWSSFHRYVKLGWYAKEWACDQPMEGKYDES